MSRSLPIWATLVRREIDDQDMAVRLIDGLALCDDVFGKLKSTLENPESPTSRIKAIEQIDKSLKHIDATREEISKIGKVADLAVVRESVKMLIASGESDRKDLIGKDAFISYLNWYGAVLSEARSRLSKSRGQPSNNPRDFLIGLLVVAFKDKAPDLPRSNKTTTLFYKIVAEFVSNHGISEGNLPRTIKRVLT